MTDEGDGKQRGGYVTWVLSASNNFEQRAN